MQAGVKRRHRPPFHPAPMLAITGKYFAAQLCWRHVGAPSRQIDLLPPVGLKDSHFFSFGKDYRYPDESAAGSTRGTSRQ